jgi:hypothetical protein
MAIASPRENIYYYECSNGRFRLTYFIPPGELKRLCDDNRISPKVLEDFPDGVDLGCTEPDFKEFNDIYGYRPVHDPDALRRTFFAILSATRNWDKYCGSGFIPAADIERRVNNIDEVLVKKKLLDVEVKSPGAQLSLKQRRQIRLRQADQKKQAYKTLRELQVDGIDSKRTLPQQVFSRIKMEEGIGAEEVFIRLHQKQRKEE